MKVNPANINRFALLKLPAAFFCGVRVKTLGPEICQTTVRHGWINQNPFNSMFWAVQGMAAELSTGALVMQEIERSGKKISMLVANNRANFSKKATGLIQFECRDGNLIAETIKNAVQTGNGQTCWMQSVGRNEKGEVVSTFDFEWTVKVKE